MSYLNMKTRNHTLINIFACHAKLFKVYVLESSFQLALIY